MDGLFCKKSRYVKTFVHLNHSSHFQHLMRCVGHGDSKCTILCQSTRIAVPQVMCHTIRQLASRLPLVLRQACRQARQCRHQIQIQSSTLKVACVAHSAQNCTPSYQLTVEQEQWYLWSVRCKCISMKERPNRCRMGFIKKVG